MGFLNKLKFRLNYKDKKVDYLYHLVVGLARSQGLEPQVLSKFTKDQVGNVEYMNKVLRGK